MLTKEKMQEIQDLKLCGLSKSEIIRHFEEKGEKPPTRPTLNKYYDMDVIPENPGANLSKPKAFDTEPFKNTIITILETTTNRNLCMSSVYDVLQEKFIENGNFESLPGNEQTLRNYVHYLERNNFVNKSEGR